MGRNRDALGSPDATLPNYDRSRGSSPALISPLAHCGERRQGTRALASLETVSGESRKVGRMARWGGPCRELSCACYVVEPPGIFPAVVGWQVDCTGVLLWLPSGAEEPKNPQLVPRGLGSGVGPGHGLSHEELLGPGEG